MTPAAFSAAISSPEYPASARTSPVCAPRSSTGCRTESAVSENLTGNPVIFTVPCPGCGTSSTISCAEAIGTRIRTQVAVQSFDGVRRMVQARLGIAVLPFGAVEPYLDATRIAMVPLAEPWATRELRIAIRDRTALGPQTRALITSLTGQPV